MKRMIAILLVAVMLACMLPAASLAATKYATVVGGWLRLRAAASFNADTVTSYYTGTRVEVLSKSGGWCHVRTPDGRTGYMYSQYLSMESGFEPTGSENAWVTSHNGYGVRLRKGPGPGYRVIRTYDVGTPVTVLQRGSYWCKINVGGTVGYMMTQFLNFGGYTPDDGSDSVICYATIWSRNGYGVRLRTGPGTNYGKIGVYSVGTTVAVLQKGTTWDRIRVGSRVGWMMNEFLSYQSNNEVTSVSLNTLTPAVGTVMSVQAVTPSRATVSYNWLVDGVVKGTASTYTVTAADVGKTIQLRVQGTGSYTGTALSAQTNKVLSDTQLSGLKLSTTAPVVGNVLTATITPAEAKVVYAWKVGGYQVSNAESYTVTANDVGKKIELIVTGTGVFHGTLSASTAEVAASANVADVSIINETAPTASAPTVGDKLAASLSPTQATVNYQWNRDGAPIAGATGSAYILTDADAGRQMSVSVKGYGAYAGEKTSAATAKVNPKPTAPVIDEIGLPEGLVGQTYATRLSAQGGGNITWKLVDGSSLPAGLTLGSDGAITGTPTREGDVTFFVLASNAAGTSAPKQFTISIRTPATPKTYTLSIEGGATFTDLAENAVVAITASAPAADQTFTGWTLVSGAGSFEDSASLSTAFHMNASDAVIKANYAAVSPDSQPTYTLTVENGSGSQSGLNAGAVVEISASAPGANMAFSGWQLVSGSGNFYNVAAASTTFTMGSSDAHICAVYTQTEDPVTYTLTVENGSGSQSGLAMDAAVEIAADAPATGMVFSGWKLVSGNGNFHNSTSSTTTFYLNGSDAVVRAEYTAEAAPETYTLTVENGSGSQNGLASDAAVTITANEPAEGKIFANWTLEGGSGNFYDSTSATTTFQMNGSSAVVRANYIDKPAPKTYSLTVEGGSGSASELAGDAVVTITANAPAADEEFTGWTLVSGDGNFYNSGSSTTDFYLKDSDAVVRANYRKIEKVKLDTPSITWAADGTSVSWSSVSGAEGYEYYRIKAADGSKTSVKSTGETSYTFVNPGLAGDEFFVKAIGNGVTTEDSSWASSIY